MPTYSYHCDTCGHDFEAVQRFADDPLRECPECGAAIRRVIQPVGVVFKGSGWYITDSRPKSSSDGDDGGSGSAKGKPASDTKPSSDTAKSDTAKSETVKSDSSATSTKSAEKVAP